MREVMCNWSYPQWRSTTAGPRQRCSFGRGCVKTLPQFSYLFLLAILMPAAVRLRSPIPPHWRQTEPLVCVGQCSARTSKRRRILLRDGASTGHVVLRPGWWEVRGMKRVLFVCIENACRSQMAEAFAKRLGAGRVAACSADSRPARHVNPRATAFMAERGQNLTAQGSKPLSAFAGQAFDVIVTMGVWCRVSVAAHVASRGLGAARSQGTSGRRIPHGARRDRTPRATVVVGAWGFLAGCSRTTVSWQVKSIPYADARVPVRNSCNTCWQPHRRP